MTERLAQRVDTLGMRIEHAAAQRVHEERQRAGHLIGRLDMLRERRIRQVEARLVLDERRLAQACALRLERCRTHVMSLERQLALLNPLSVLERGFSLTRTAEGLLVRSTAGAVTGMALVTQVKDGTIRSVVS
jgi:exodeoxyribonuclease VII large subunit